ncbi:MAG: hydrogenase nickel incorporation protein HypB [Lachnospiraceae bacterium]|nr:hydrogenase nickel incorporation protein HypB [Lachnospiraceae bacterium]
MKEIKVVKQIMEWNDDVSDKIKELTASKNVCIINVMGSPGAGKTSLITRLIEELSKEYKIGVIEGDITDTIDAVKIDELGIPVVQLQTDGACHIEAMSIEHILPMFNLDELDIIFVENIGNLVCPAEFNIGENFRIAILSVPEGDDKVAKYPLMFSTSDFLVMHKYDMKEYFDFDDKRVEKDTLDRNPKAKIFRVSSKTGDGLSEFVEAVKDKVSMRS